MEISRAADHATATGKPEWFTGAVWNEMLAVGQPPSRLHVARVTFAPGARTRWHTHPDGKVLLAVSGIGRVQKDGEPVRVLGPGDTVSIAAGERHWHGAAPGHVFVHVAMQEAGSDGRQADWLEPVADDVYAQEPDWGHTVGTPP